MEGGCYAKLIDLDAGKEPDIHGAVNRFGAIMENVKLNPDTREVDFQDAQRTENTRGSYSLKALKKVFNQTHESQVPSSVIFLTADAFGALPAVARLDEWQAQYHFLSGYTAKVAGTEIGIKEPQATFSACFGAPFMPRPAGVYASLLSQMISKHKVPVWLVNTGWTNGGYGKGPRFPISVSRAIVRGIQSGEMLSVPMEIHPVFGFLVPKEFKGIDPQSLKFPEGEQVQALADRFRENAKAQNISVEICEKGGPFLKKISS